VIAYLDSSVLLRVVLGQHNALKEWGRVTKGIASALVEVECVRTLDRLRLVQGFSDEIIAEQREAVYRVLEAVEIVEITYPVLSRAAQPLPTALGTLDAIHLATALLWKEQMGKDLSMATHDVALAVAARASGLRVVGA
jgi:predicted nucleic acid-binding protein